MRLNLDNLLSHIRNTYGELIIWYAQKEYDQWITRNLSSDVSGGICDRIAIAIVKLLRNDEFLCPSYIEDHNIPHTNVRVQWAYQVENEAECGFPVVIIDIPWEKYERCLIPGESYVPIDEVVLNIGDLIITGYMHNEPYVCNFTYISRMENELDFIFSQN